MWIVEMNIAGFRFHRWTRRRRTLLLPSASPLELWMRPSDAS